MWLFILRIEYCSRTAWQTWSSLLQVMHCPPMGANPLLEPMLTWRKFDLTTFYVIRMKNLDICRPRKMHLKMSVKYDRLGHVSIWYRSVSVCCFHGNCIMAISKCNKSLKNNVFTMWAIKSNTQSSDEDIWHRGRNKRKNNSAKCVKQTVSVIYRAHISIGTRFSS